MNGLRRVAIVLAAVIALAAAGPHGRADELVTFDATPTEYEWRALHSDANQWGWDYLLIDQERFNPIEWRDVYRLPAGMALDVDDDGIEEVLLAILHPAACDTEGCDALLLESELPDHATPRLRFDGVLHLPILESGSARILILEDDFVFLEPARYGLLSSFPDIDGGSATSLIRSCYGQITLDRLNSEDIGFAEIDLNGDWRPEVIVAIDAYTNCGNHDDCGGGIFSPDPEDTLGPYP